MSPNLTVPPEYKRFVTFYIRLRSKIFDLSGGRRAKHPRSKHAGLVLRATLFLLISHTKLLRFPTTFQKRKTNQTDIVWNNTRWISKQPVSDAPG